MNGVPYANASSDMRAREEVKKVLRGFGCESIGFMDNYDKHAVVLAFTHRGRAVQLRASAKGWAQMWLKQNPWTHRHRTLRIEYEQAALRQGQVAVNSILRDWIKGQITAIETGVLSFVAVFMPYMLTADGAPDRASRRNKSADSIGAAEGDVAGEGIARRGPALSRMAMSLALLKGTSGRTGRTDRYDLPLHPR